MKAGHIFLLLLWGVHLMNLMGTRTLMRRVLFRLFDYRDCYIIRSGKGNKFKWGIGYNAPARAKGIDRSIPGSKEELQYYWRLFFARYWEDKIRGELGDTRFRHKGSGATEWHKFRGLVIRSRLVQLKLRVRAVWLYQQMIWLSCQALAVLAVVILLSTKYPKYF